MEDQKWKILSRIESTLIALIFALTRASKKHRLPLSAFKQSQSIFILGNGPCFETDEQIFSLEMQSNPKMAVNFFAKSDLFTSLQPEYYILADAVFFNPKNTLSVDQQKIQQEMIQLLNEKVNWSMTLIFPSEAQKHIHELEIQNPNIQFIFFNANKADGKVFSWIKTLLWKHNWASVSKMNVLISATFCALNLGFKRVILLGADHSWSENFRIDEKNRAYMYDPHFYDQGNEPVFLYKNSITQKSLSSKQFFQGLATAFEAYEELHNYAKKIEAIIENGSSKSYIDTFKRIQKY